MSDVTTDTQAGGWEISSGDLSLLSALRELLANHELVFFLAYRDIVVRYKQSLLGLGWTITQPAAMMLMLTAVFDRIARIPSQGIPYPLFVFCAILPWNLFSSTLTKVSSSLVGSTTLVTKVYFPRLAIPVSIAIVPLVDFAVVFILLAVVIKFAGIPIGPASLLFPLYALIGWFFALGLGIWLTALHVRYRDIPVIVPLALQMGMYASPVAYPSNLVPPQIQAYYNLNPIVSVVDGCRWAMLGTPSPPWTQVLLACVIATIVLISSLLFFQKTEGRFSDEI